MDLDWGRLAKIDRRLLSGLGHHERYQMVRVSVSDAMWSTSRRYCAALGVSMGRGIAGLIAQDLGEVVGPDTDDRAVFAAGLQRQLPARSEDLECSGTPPRRKGTVAQGIVASAAGPVHPALIGSPCGGWSERAVPIWLGLQVRAVPRQLIRCTDHLECGPASGDQLDDQGRTMDGILVGVGTG